MAQDSLSPGTRAILAGVIRAKALDGKECDWYDPHSGCVWVDVERPGPDELKALEARFAMHPLALEDALEPGHWSHYEQYPAHELITFRTLRQPNGHDNFTERLGPTAVSTKLAIAMTYP